MSPPDPGEVARKRSPADGPDGPEAARVPEDVPSLEATVRQAGPALRSCEAKLLGAIRGPWALAFGTREVRLLIEYQDGVPVLIRVTGNQVKEEKLR